MGWAYPTSIHFPYLRLSQHPVNYSSVLATVARGALQCTANLYWPLISYLLYQISGQKTGLNLKVC